MNDLNKPVYKGRGGWRGGGRPKGSKCKHTIVASEERAKIQHELAKHEYELVALKLKIAKGEVLVGNYIDEKTGQVDKVFRQPPNNQAIDWCLEYIAGKTPDKSENKTDIPQLDIIAQTLRDVANSKTR